MKSVDLQPTVKTLVDMINASCADGPIPTIDHIIVTVAEMIEIEKEFSNINSVNAGVFGRNGDKYYGGNLSINAQNIHTITHNFGTKETPDMRPLTEYFYLNGVQVRLEKTGFDTSSFGRKDT